MNHPKFPDTAWLEKIACGILDLVEERNYWRAKAFKFEVEVEDRRERDHQQYLESLAHSGRMLESLLDPNNGLARAARAVERDPLKGAVAEEQE